MTTAIAAMQSTVRTRPSTPQNLEPIVASLAASDVHLGARGHHVQEALIVVGTNDERIRFASLPRGKTFQLRLHRIHEGMILHHHLNLVPAGFVPEPRHRFEIGLKSLV